MDLNKMREFFDRRINGLEWPAVVSLGKKHCDRWFSCANRAELERVCLAILWERYHCDNYYVEDMPDKEPPITRDDKNAMPSGMTKVGAADDWNRYDAAVKRHHDSTSQFKTIEASLRDRDGAIAFAVLEARNDHEYENFAVESGIPPELPVGNLLSVKP